VKILYYSPHPGLNLSSPAGYGTHMRGMIKAFRELGHEVEICIMGGENLIDGPAQNSSFLKRSIKKALPPLLWETAKDLDLLKLDHCSKILLDKKVRSFRPDVVYERGFYLMTSGVEIARKYNVMHLMEMNSPYPEERVKMSGKSMMIGHAKKMERIQLQATSRLVVVSTALRDHFDRILPGTAAKACITPNAVTPDEIILNQEHQFSLRRKYGIRDDDIVFGFVGSFFPHHGIDLLIQAFAHVQARVPEAYLLIVGDGEIKRELQALANDLPCSDRICFTGNVQHDEVYDHISIMNVSVMARSNWYSSPVKIFEYGALGKPVIAPDCLPVRDVMTTEYNSLLVRPQVDDIVDAMIKLVRDAELRQKIGSEFQKKVLSEHTWEKMAEKILYECRRPVN
jgi:glycosyltransferase involved in cell wall biosynthesis